MEKIIYGGTPTYGHVVGILMSDSNIPRIPGDPGNAETFGFPVIYEILRGFPFEDLINLNKEHIGILIEKAKLLEERGACLIVVDCGLFAFFQNEMKEALSVPFIGSSLDMVPMIKRFLPAEKKVGILTGDTNILTSSHLEVSGIDPADVSIVGMENSEEFQRVVIDRELKLNKTRMREDVIKAALGLGKDDLGAIVIECTNIISYRKVLQESFRLPVYDLVSLIEFWVSGLRLIEFKSAFI